MPPIVQIATFLFLMLGPFKIIGPFAKLTAHASNKLINQIALRATLFASLSLLTASFLGEQVLNNFGIPVPILAMTGGLILFLVALINIISQYTPDDSKEDYSVPTIRLAINPLAFPTIVTPYGLAAVIVFMAISPTNNDKLNIGIIVVGIMIINLLVMLVTRYMGKIFFLLLSILGSVLGVVQVALGLWILINQLKSVFGLTGGL